MDLLIRILGAVTGAGAACNVGDRDEALVYIAIAEADIRRLDEQRERFVAAIAAVRKELTRTAQLCGGAQIETKVSR